MLLSKRNLRTARRTSRRQLLGRYATATRTTTWRERLGCKSTLRICATTCSSCSVIFASSYVEWASRSEKALSTTTLKYVWCFVPNTYPTITT